MVNALFDPAEARLGSSLDQLISDGRDVGHALARLVHGDLAGLFDGPSTVAFDPALPMVSLDLSRISGSDQLIGLVMTLRLGLDGGGARRSGRRASAG